MLNIIHPIKKKPNKIQDKPYKLEYFADIQQGEQCNFLPFSEIMTDWQTDPALTE